MKLHITDSILFATYLREQGLSVPTIKNYIGTLNKFFKSNPDIDDSNSYHQHLVYCNKDRNIYSAYYAIKSFIKFKFADNIALRNRLLDELSTKEVRRLVRVKLRRHPYCSLTDDDVINIVNNFMSEKNKIIFLIQLKTGLRIGDVLSLTKESAEYNREKGVLVLTLITKGGKIRTVSLYKDIAEVVYYFIEHNSVCEISDYVFLEKQNMMRKNTANILSSLVDNNNVPIDTMARIIKFNYDIYYSDFKQAIAKAGFDSKLFATHYLRRRFARKVWDRYKDMEKLKLALGHSAVETSARYLRDSGQDVANIFEDLENV